MLYTSRYSNPELKKGIYYVVGIALGRPKFYLGYVENSVCILFAPERSMWGKSHEEFTRLYTSKMDKIGADKVKSIIHHLVSEAGGRDIVFCCYEDIRDKTQTCHRTVFAEWVKEHLGYDIIELPDDSPIRHKKPTPARKIAQSALF